MVFLIILAFIALLACAITGLAQAIDNYDRNRPARWVVIPTVVLLASLIAIGSLSVYSYNRSLTYKRGKCAKWATTSHYPTKFVNIGYGDWACWANVNGKWIPTEQIRGLDE